MKRKDQPATALAVIYARYSPRPKRRRDGQEIVCESCDLQIEHCRKWAAEHGLEVVGVFHDDAASGGSTEGRPELRKALDLAKAKRATFVAYSLSRWARSTADAIHIASELQAADAPLVSLKENLDTSNAYGRFLYAIFAALAELEREQIRERTSDAMQRHVRNGRAVSSRAPYGYRRNPLAPAMWIEDEQEQATLRRMLELAGEDLSQREIGRRLDAEGLLCRGHRWHHDTVGRVLARARAIQPSC